MRLVTSVGYCNEVGESEYAANEVTYLSNKPGMVGAERHQFVLTCDMGGSLAEISVKLRPVLSNWSNTTSVYASNWLSPVPHATRG